MRQYDVMTDPFDEATLSAIGELLAVGEQEGFAITFAPDAQGWTVGYMRGMGGGDLISGYDLEETAKAAMRPLLDLAARYAERRREREERERKGSEWADGEGPRDDVDAPPLGSLPSTQSLDVSFANLDATEFEEFIYDLLVTLGFRNVDWRKGTSKKSSPSDRGRDIVAQSLVTDVDGHTRFETWFVDAKHYERGVPPEALQGLMTWAESERPDVALVASSGFLSNAAKDWIENYRKNRAPAFRIRHWEKPELSRMLAVNRDLMARHDIIEAESMRTIAELRAAEQEFFDKVWYVRSLIHDEAIATGDKPPLDDKLRAQVDAARSAVIARYGADEVGPWDDWDWGYVNGKLAAVRWMLGNEWDFLDT